MKKIALIAALISFAANFAFAEEVKGQLKDGSAVHIDNSNQMWVMKDGKEEKVSDGQYIITNEGKEMTFIVKDGVATAQ